MSQENIRLAQRFLGRREPYEPPGHLKQKGSAGQIHERLSRLICRPKDENLTGLLRRTKQVRNLLQQGLWIESLAAKEVEIGVAASSGQISLCPRSSPSRFAFINRVSGRPQIRPLPYLVSEILRGGYGQAVIDKTQAQREEREKIHQLRASQRQQEQTQREESSLKVAQKLEFFELLPADKQQALRLQVDLQAREEGFLRLPGWGHEHPAYRGLLSELVGKLEAELNRRE